MAERRLLDQAATVFRRFAAGLVLIMFSSLILLVSLAFLAVSIFSKLAALGSYVFPALMVGLGGLALAVILLLVAVLGIRSR